MSVTISVVPAVRQSAYRPVIFEATSNRNNSNTYSTAVVSSGTGAFSRYTLTHDFKVGDIITGSDFVPTGYNVRQTVTVISGTAWFETDLTFISIPTGTRTVTRTNDNFQLKGEVMVFDQTKKTVSGITDAGGGLIEVTAASHGYSVDDYVFIEEATNYNKLYKIVSSSGANVFRVTETWINTQTGTVRKGTVLGSKRMNDVLISSVKTFRFSIANYLQSSLAPDLISSIGANIYTPTPNTIKWYGIYFTEEFDDKDGLLKDGDVILSSQYQVIRATLQHTETQNFDNFIITASASTTKRFLTNYTKRKIKIGEEDQISFLGNKLVNYSVRWLTNLSDGSLDALWTNYGVGIFDGRGIIPVNTNMLTAGVTTLRIYVQGGGNQLSEEINYTIDKKCSANAKRIIFENYLGGFDAYTFTGGFKQINSSKKSSYRRDLGITFAVRDRGETTLGIETETAFEIWSEFLTKAEGLWLAELLNSPNVFLASGTDIIPIIVFNSSDTLFDSGVPSQLKLQYRHANNPITLNN